MKLKSSVDSKMVSDTITCLQRIIDEQDFDPEIMELTILRVKVLLTGILRIFNKEYLK